MTVTSPPRETALDTLRVAIVGEVDHGKSTLLGRLLLDTGAITPDRLTTTPAEGGLAFLLDALHEEQADLFTLDTTQAVVDAGSRRFVFIDVPGHAELLRNMVTGASRASVGMVVVDVTQRTQRQTRRHLRILEMLGVTTCVCVVTKMDLVGYDQAAFDAVVAEIFLFAQECGVEVVDAVPVSSIDGVNVTEREPLLLPWYRGESLVGTLHGIAVHEVANSCVRFAVQAVTGTGATRRILGRVESGDLVEGVVLNHRTGSCRVERIARFGEPPLPVAHAGDSVGLTVSGEAPVAGDLLGPPDRPLTIDDIWRARLLCTSDDGIATGDRLTLRHGSASVHTVLTAVSARADSASLAPIRDLNLVAFSDFADVVITLDEPTPADDIRTCAPTGRFMVCDEDGNALAVGVIEGFGLTPTPAAVGEQATP